MNIDNTDGSLQVLTGVDGVAARMGHRLTLTVQRWQAEVGFDGDQPTRVTLTADIDSLIVVSGEGGVTPLTAPERLIARSNALKSLQTKRFPAITFDAETVEPSSDGYRLSGTLEIHGTRREHVVDVAVTDRISGRSQVRQTDFGIKPYSLMMGSLRVADAVTVVFEASATGTHR